MAGSGMAGTHSFIIKWESKLFLDKLLIKNLQTTSVRAARIIYAAAIFGKA
jgi:hypothetical protein